MACEQPSGVWIGGFLDGVPTQTASSGLGGTALQPAPGQELAVMVKIYGDLETWTPGEGAGDYRMFRGYRAAAASVVRRLSRNSITSCIIKSTDS
ncbi:hypothetical protein NQZ68_025539 [Dissostichus eleginoides]|nr:hypothetical protein NQZ68_025539 [Dissostichus eleginoides]